MHVTAIDLASTAGICWGNPGKEPAFAHVRLSREGDAGSMEGVAEVTARAIEWFARHVEAHPTDRVAIEAPIPERALSGHTNAWSTALKYSLIGSIAAICRLKSLPVAFHNIQRIRKHFIGHGNLRGDQAKREVMRFCKAAGWKPETYDESDAGAVWHYECYRCDPRSIQPIDPIFLKIPPVTPQPRRSDRVQVNSFKFGPST